MQDQWQQCQHQDPAAEIPFGEGQGLAQSILHQQIRPLVSMWQSFAPTQCSEEKVEEKILLVSKLMLEVTLNITL